MASNATLHRWDEIPNEEVADGIWRRFISGDRAMLARLDLAKGAIVPKHSHENEQITYIVQGALRFWMGEDEAAVSSPAYTSGTAAAARRSSRPAPGGPHGNVEKSLCTIIRGASPLGLTLPRPGRAHLPQRCVGDAPLSRGGAKG